MPAPTQPPQTWQRQRGWGQDLTDRGKPVWPGCGRGEWPPPLTECSGSVPAAMQMKEPGMDIYILYSSPEPANPEMQFRAGSLATSLSLGYSTALVYFFPWFLTPTWIAYRTGTVHTVSRNVSISIVTRNCLFSAAIFFRWKSSKLKNYFCGSVVNRVSGSGSRKAKVAHKTRKNNLNVLKRWIFSMENWRLSGDRSSNMYVGLRKRKMEIRQNIFF
jgi:hypothetical protein